MRLLNVKKYTFKVFYEPNIPPYIIASHRWTDDEASMKDVQKNRNVTSAGFRKVLGFCETIKHSWPEIKWLWIDTVCIDQKSSAEVNEAVNSMFKWYKKAHLCLAYLRDVPDKTLGNSEWFTRGWTLQELLAPREVWFLDANWERLAIRSDVAGLLEHVTGISAKVLHNNHNLRDIPVEERVGWIERRTTTRPEDLAYCMLGICGVYMSLIYGEGRNAWNRLANEVSKKRGRYVVLSRPNALSGEGSTVSGTDLHLKWHTGDAVRNLLEPTTLLLDPRTPEPLQLAFSQQTFLPHQPLGLERDGTITKSNGKQYGKPEPQVLNREGRNFPGMHLPYQAQPEVPRTRHGIPLHTASRQLDQPKKTQDFKRRERSALASGKATPTLQLNSAITKPSTRRHTIPRDVVSIQQLDTGMNNSSDDDDCDDSTAAECHLGLHSIRHRPRKTSQEKATTVATKIGYTNDWTNSQLKLYEGKDDILPAARAEHIDNRTNTPEKLYEVT